MHTHGGEKPWTRATRPSRTVHGEAERYREAAELALDQLQWCVDYLYRIQKPTLAKGLRANREQIRAELRRIAGAQLGRMKVSSRRVTAGGSGTRHRGRRSSDGDPGED